MNFLPSSGIRLAVVLLAVGGTAAARQVERLPAQEAVRALPRPESVLGFRPGDSHRLAGWTAISTYLDSLGKTSDRIRVDTIGRSTLDRPMLLLTISSPRNLARLGEIRSMQARLADPRLIGSEQEREQLIRDGRLVVLVTAGLHSNEVGSSLLPVRLAYHLASSDAADVQRALDETVVLLVPALNPDGVDMVSEWYESTLDMPWEGADPPFLYHHYAGHDNNRDWTAFTLQETEVVVRRVYNEWHPQIVHDVHQQRSDGSRYFVPPWHDPIEPHIDPVLIAGANALGTSIAWSMTQDGRPGVVVAGDFDAWNPARAYPHYHAGVRILSETASARLASPVDLQPDELRPGRGYDPREATWNQPWPWPGGRWGLAQILDYMEAGALALLRFASRDR
ncbi:MAG: M14 family metallopeptidase, partial [Gemmatimonadota bacterium]